MAISPGTRLGSYEIVAALGAGGMGEVYRARDTHLKRDVAIKVLPHAFAQDADRLARFQREAELLATLNHPNIAAVYGLEKADGLTGIVLELVEGETLAEKIATAGGSRRTGTALPLDKAVAIARQIAEALNAAHEKGVIHRDLKPANIKVRQDGTVKVLDFGLAKLALSQTPGDHADATASPTITSPAMVTGMGVILGTAAYMSPERAKGQEADRRCDIWAFGVVLYEMLTGCRPFDGEDMADVLGAVVRLEPDWAALSPEVPSPVRTLVQSCLVKDPRRRMADISTALFVLDKTASLAALDGIASAAMPRQPQWRHIVTPVAAALLTAATVGSGIWFATRLPEAIPPRVSRLALSPSGTALLSINGLVRDVAITPDGSRIVYVGNRGTQLFVRALDSLEPVVVYTGAPRGPFVSPDSQWIGFADDHNVLKKVPVTGGPAVTLATFGDDDAPRGVTWAPDNTIIVATNSGATGLLRVTAAGGSVTVLTRPDRAHGEADHLWPEVLPSGRAVLFTITALTGGLDAAQVAVLDLQSGIRTILLRGGSHAHYVPSGHLVYAAAGALRAVPFDLGRLETRGTPVPVIPDVVTTAFGAVDAAVASDGTLAYVSGAGGGAATQRTLVWVDRQGRETPIPAPPRAYLFPRLSPDGTRIAVYAIDQGLDIWLWDLGRHTFVRTTSDPGIDTFPVWTPDGGHVIFGSQRTGIRNLFWQAPDGTGGAQRLTESPNRQDPTAVSPDGRQLIFTEVTPKTAEDVMQMTLDGTRRVTPLVQSPLVDRNGIVSPDGRWLAYEANDSGPFEIFVRPYPEVNSGHWQVSTAGGTRPLWAQSGKELFFVAPTGALMRVGVERGLSWAATIPTQVVKEGYLTIPGSFPGRTYDVAHDGQTFLMIKPVSGVDQTATPTALVIVQHWGEELKRLVPTK